MKVLFVEFGNSLLKKVKYPARVILKALSLYNIGHTQAEICKIIKQRHKLSIPQTTLSTWIKQYSSICTFSRLRKQALKLYPPEKIIFSQKLQHKQVYDFKVHNAKIELLAKELPEQKFQSLESYLKKIPTEQFPGHIFTIHNEGLGQRASELKFDTLKFNRSRRQNFANVLASLGLQLAKTNKERHQAVQNFMIANDSVTIACEVPVYLTKSDISYFKNKGFTFYPEKYRTPITGHIDILQIRNGLIYILDYKPEASKVNPIEQLTTYALSLSRRTKLAVRDFKCAWFDDRNYYEFFPLHAVFLKRHPA